ncbi:hypothetical protein PIB30_043190 [Stylosanthes scabra]|uniref:SWIM-type domain-containing protein n=1 Tax=Stylosanthes scabra TaxID=79078 RepID=A0ABU6WDJ4_9FABA|nr:hypothetical protein [Stylosanthes scabra]
MPCVHAVAAICKMRVRPVEDFVSPFLTMDAVRATYDIHINLVNSEDFWYPTNGPIPIAPRIVRPPGRPRKKRTKAARPPPQPVNGDKPKKKKAKVQKGETSKNKDAATNAPKPTIDDVIARARKQKKKMPKRPYVPTDPREEIPVSQSAPPMPLRAKQKIFRPPAPFGDVHFSTRPAQHQFSQSSPHSLLNRMHQFLKGHHHLCPEQVTRKFYLKKPELQHVEPQLKGFSSSCLP